MVLDGFIHVPGEKVVSDFVGVLEHEPAPCAIDWKNTYFLASGFDKVSDLISGELQEIFQ
jgi:hypothetical protein